MSTPTEQERLWLLQTYENFSQQKQARAVSYKVAVKVNVVYSGNSQQPYLNYNEVYQIIANANAYLQNINVELYLLDNQVFFVQNDKYTDLKLSDERELREIYDVKNAINVYFVKSIVQADQTVLAGYANLPSSYNVSNRIFCSYFNKSTEDYNLLKNKLFLHELGHYFGLLHTFQDSDHTDVMKREVVTRGSASNCYTAGDQLCDTEADPYERLSNVSTITCSNPVPADVVDIYGDHYTPPINNLMSYTRNCGNVFTAQQFRKMQASFAIRFSPSNDYQVVAQNPNFIQVFDFDKKTYCLGDTLKVNYNLEGNYAADNQLSLEISDKNGNNFRQISYRKVGKQLHYIIPNTLSEGNEYRIQLRTTQPAIVSPISEHFAIKTPSSVYLTTTYPTISSGETTDIYVNFTGSGAWWFELSDGTSVKTTNQNPYRLTRKLNQTTYFGINSAGNACGNVVSKAGVQIEVKQGVLKTALATTTFCKKQPVSLTLLNVEPLDANDQYIIQILNPATNTYQNLPTAVNGNFLQAQFPDNQAVGSGYWLKVTTRNGKFNSSPIGPLVITDMPPMPTLLQLSVCQSYADSATVGIPQGANGYTYRWYEKETDTKPIANFKPDTKFDLTTTYYLSQTDALGCESNKSKVAITVKPLPVGYISGDKTIMKGDSAFLFLDIVAGELPVVVTISDGRDFTMLKNSIGVLVKPDKTADYRIKEVKNACGVGSSLGIAKIVVLEPLANELVDANEWLTVYPNPVFSDKIVLKFNRSVNESVRLKLFNPSGKLFYEKALKFVTEAQQEEIDISALAAGNYMLEVFSEKLKIQKKKIIIQN